MALTADILERLETLLSSQEALAPADIRKNFPGLSITWCDASDVGVEPPYRRYPQFNLYLVDGSDHCRRLTPDLSRATGLLLARLYAES